MTAPNPSAGTQRSAVEALRHHRPLLHPERPDWARVECGCGLSDNFAGWWAHITVEVVERNERASAPPSLDVPEPDELALWHETLVDAARRLDQVGTGNGAEPLGLQTDFLLAVAEVRTAIHAIDRLTAYSEASAEQAGEKL